MPLRELQVPFVASPSDDKENNTNGGWDETITMEWKEQHLRRNALPPPLCRHATAFGSCVYGTVDSSLSSSRSNDNNGNQNNKNDSWLSWERSFAPHMVCRVESNADGSIVAVTTDGGTVSLLRGQDGSVLATRKISADRGIQRGADLCFVSGGIGGTGRGRDVLLIAPPANDQSSSRARENGSSDGNAEKNAVRLIIVSSIDGETLNSDTPAMVADAARNMSVDSCLLRGVQAVVALQACRDNEGNDNKIRIAAIDSTGVLSLHDFDLAKKESSVVCPSVALNDNERLASNIGLSLDHSRAASYLLLCGYTGESSLRLIWFDIFGLTIASSFALSSMAASSTRTTSGKTKVLRITPMNAFPSEDDSILATAVVVHDAGMETPVEIRIVQVCSEETMGLSVLSSPHEAFRIPLPGFGPSPPTVAALAGPYAFRAMADKFTSYDSNNNSSSNDEPAVLSRDFLEPNRTALVGKIRLCLAKERFNEAIASLDLSTRDKLRPLLHWEEVHFLRLQSTMTNARDPSARKEAEASLRALCESAMQQSKEANRYLIESAAAVLDLPNQYELRNSKSGNERSHEGVTVNEYVAALSGMQQALGMVLREIGSATNPELSEAQHRVESCLDAFRCLQDIVSLDGMCAIDAAFRKIRNLRDLFSALVSGGLFKTATKMWKSAWVSKLGPEVIVSAFLATTPIVHPVKYATILCDGGILKLSPTHEYIPLVRAWACQLADKLDTDQGVNGLRLGTELLKVCRLSNEQGFIECARY